MSVYSFLHCCGVDDLMLVLVHAVMSSAAVHGMPATPDLLPRVVKKSVVRMPVKALIMRAAAFPLQAPEGRSPGRARTVISWVQCEAQGAAQDAQRGAGRSRLGTGRLDPPAPVAAGVAGAPAPAPAGKEGDASGDGGKRAADEEDGAGSERAEPGRKGGKKEKKDKHRTKEKRKRKERVDYGAGGGEDDGASVGGGSSRKEAKKDRKDRRHKKERFA